MSYSRGGYRAIGQLDISAGAALPTVDPSALKTKVSSSSLVTSASYQAPTAFGPISIMTPPASPQPAPSAAPTKAGSVGAMCDMVDYLRARLPPLSSALFKLPTGVSVNGQQILELLGHRQIKEICSQPRGTKLGRDGQEEYYVLDFVRQQLPPEPAPAPPPAVAPEVSAPHDSTSPVSPEAEYYQDEWSTADQAAMPGERGIMTPVEPSAVEPLLPQEKKFPWLLVLGGAAVVGVGGYLLLR